MTAAVADAAGPDPAGSDPTGAVPVGPVSRREVRIREIRVLGVTLRVALWPGTPGGTPLLLFNGIGASFELLAPFVDEMGGTEVIAFDVPGTGGSQTAPVPYRLWMLAVLTGRLLDELGLDRVDVLGVSWGGTIAQQFAAQNPRRCRRLVLAATTAGMLMVPPPPSILLKFATPRRYNDAQYRSSIAGEIYGGKARTDGDVAHLFRRTRWTGYVMQQLALAGWTSVPWLPLVRQPTLVLAGVDDPVIPTANARLLGRLIPNSRVHLVDDGHLFLISSAEVVGPVVREFLTIDAKEAA